jgi:hypothetical protein
MEWTSSILSQDGKLLLKTTGDCQSTVTLWPQCCQSFLTTGLCSKLPSPEYRTSPRFTRLDGEGHFIVLLVVFGTTNLCPSFPKVLPPFFPFVWRLIRAIFEVMALNWALEHLLDEDVGWVVATGGEKLVRDFLTVSRVVSLLERLLSVLLKNLLSWGPRFSVSDSGECNRLLRPLN